MKYCFGVDIGGTTVKIGLFDTEGTILDKWEIVTRKENKGENILPDISKSIEEKLEEKSIDKKDVVGIGTGIPAPINAEGIVNGSANLGWGYKEVKKEFEELTGLKVLTGNDANVAALGEMWKGSGNGAKNMIMVTLGTGVGGGIIIDGKILGGEHGAGGEIGHICVDYSETDKCGCGNKGCLEQYASATGIVRLAKRKLINETRDTKLKNFENITAKDVFDSVKDKDEVALEIAQEFGRYIGAGLSIVCAIADPSVIVIGGGVSKAGSILLDYVKAGFKDRCFFANKSVEFVLASLGNDAGICGSAKMVLDTL